jgi:hypothetical protein
MSPDTTHEIFKTPTGPPEKTSKETALTDWSFKRVCVVSSTATFESLSPARCSSNSTAIVVEGRGNKHPTRRWQSTPIVTRIDARHLATQSGHLYSLVGPADEQRLREGASIHVFSHLPLSACADLQAVFPEHLVALLREGLPVNWEAQIEAAMRRGRCAFSVVVVVFHNKSFDAPSLRALPKIAPGVEAAAAAATAAAESSAALDSDDMVTIKRRPIARRVVGQQQRQEEEKEERKKEQQRHEEERQQEASAGAAMNEPSDGSEKTDEQPPEVAVEEVVEEKKQEEKQSLKRKNKNKTDEQAKEQKQQQQQKQQQISKRHRRTEVEELARLPSIEKKGPLSRSPVRFSLS